MNPRGMTRHDTRQILVPSRLGGTLLPWCGGHPTSSRASLAAVFRGEASPIHVYQMGRSNTHHPDSPKSDTSRSSKKQHHNCIGRFLAQLQGCWVQQSDVSDPPSSSRRPLPSVQPAKESASLPETHSRSTALSGDSCQSWFDESFYQGCVAPSASEKMEVDMGSCTADRRSSPYDHYQQQQQLQQQQQQEQQRQQYLQAQTPPQHMEGLQQMSQQASCASTVPAGEVGVIASAVDRARVAMMLDALVVQQPLFMSNKYVKLADLNR